MDLNLPSMIHYILFIITSALILNNNSFITYIFKSNSHDIAYIFTYLN